MKAAPLPPLAREAALVDGWLWIYAGSKAWTLVGRGDDCRAVIYPAGRKPTDYTWPVRGLTVVVIGHDRNTNELSDLVATLIHAGAAGVWLQHDSIVFPEWYDANDLRRSA